jgi:hypothetical protein
MRRALASGLILAFAVAGCSTAKTASPSTTAAIAGGGAGASVAPSTTPTTSPPAPTTTTTSPVPAEMSEWLLASHTATLDLATVVASLDADAMAVSIADVPSGVETLLSDSCPDNAQDVQEAQALPAAPIPLIQQDWQALMASFAPIVSGCNSTDTTFFQEWPTLKQAVGAANTKLGSDITALGYCEPSATCLPPYVL